MLSGREAGYVSEKELRPEVRSSHSCSRSDDPPTELSDKGGEGDSDAVESNGISLGEEMVGDPVRGRTRPASMIANWPATEQQSTRIWIVLRGQVKRKRQKRSSSS